MGPAPAARAEKTTARQFAAPTPEPPLFPSAYLVNLKVLRSLAMVVKANSSCSPLGDLK